MKSKLLLPMMAMIFAVGMAFTTAETTVEENAEKYVLVDGTWRTVELFDCGSGQEECSVMFQEDLDAVIYPIYNTKDVNDPVLGNGGVTIHPGTVPSN